MITITDVSKAHSWTAGTTAYKVRTMLQDQITFDQVQVSSVEDDSFTTSTGTIQFFITTEYSQTMDGAVKRFIANLPNESINNDALVNMAHCFLARHHRFQASLSSAIKSARDKGLGLRWINVWEECYNLSYSSIALLDQQRGWTPKDESDVDILKQIRTRLKRAIDIEKEMIDGIKKKM